MRRAKQMTAAMARIPGIKDLKLYRELGQPNLNFTVDRRQAARFGINVADIQDAIETAVGGKAVSQVLQGRGAIRRGGALSGALSQRTQKAIANIRLLSPSGERVSLAQLTKVEVRDGAYDIYREKNNRYVAVTFNVRGRDLGSTVEEAITQNQPESQISRQGITLSGRENTKASSAPTSGWRSSCPSRSSSSSSFSTVCFAPPSGRC